VSFTTSKFNSLKKKGSARFPHSAMWMACKVLKGAKFASSSTTNSLNTFGKIVYLMTFFANYVPSEIQIVN